MSRIRIAALAAMAAAALTVPAAASAATTPASAVSSLAAGITFDGMLMQVQSQRATLLDRQIKDQIAAIEQRNAKLAALNAELKRLQAANAAANGGIQALEAKIEALNAQIDELSSRSQIDMRQLQSLTLKRNEAFEPMTGQSNKLSDTHASIIANFR